MNFRFATLQTNMAFVKWNTTNKEIQALLKLKGERGIVRLLAIEGNSIILERGISLEKLILSQDEGNRGFDRRHESMSQGRYSTFGYQT
jgi:hypothetical protein